MVPFHMLSMVSSQCALKCYFVLRRAVFELFDFKNIVTLKSGSEVTQGHPNRHRSIRTYDFPLTSHSNRTISEINGDFSRKSQFFSPPVYLTRPLKGFPWKWVSMQRLKKTRMMGLPDGEKRFKIGLAV